MTVGYDSYEGLGGENSSGGNDGVECHYVAAMRDGRRGWFMTAARD